MKKLNILKRIGTVFLSSVILFTSIDVTAFSTGNHTDNVIIDIEDMESSDEHEKIFYMNEVSDDTETENSIQEADSMDDFQEEIIQLNQNTDLDSDSLYASKRLIVITDDSDFDTYESENAIAYGNLYVLSYSSESAARNAYNALKKNSDITSVEIDSIVETSSIIEMEPAEAGNAITETVITSDDITLPANASDISIAVIDSGIDKNNPMFYGRIVDLGLNFSTSGDGIQDDNGHGTAVASVIANNSGAKIMPIKIANNDGKGTVLSLYLAIQAAMKNNADIINISMTTSSSDLLTSVIEEANKEGIIVIASAGNESANVENYAPANIDGVIAISSLDSNYLLSEFSNCGDSISYAAIGEDFEVPNLYGNMVEMSGTSLSAAYVSAVMAYAMENKDDFNDYVYDLGEEGKDSIYGYGVVSLEDVLEKGNSDIEIPESGNKVIEENTSEVNIAAIAAMNTDFNATGAAFVSSDAYQSNARGTAPYTYTVYRYQAGSRKSSVTADKGTRVFSSKGTHTDNAVGDTTDISLGKKNTDKLNQIPRQTALSGYFPANTTITFKIKVRSCGHTTDSYCGLKVKTVPEDANANFDKYTVSARRNSVVIPTDKTGAGTYTGTAAYKIGANDWVENSVDYKFTYDSSTDKYRDGDGDSATGSYWSNYDVNYPSTASTAVNANEVWITARGGGSGAYIEGITSRGTVTMMVTYTCTKTGNYEFDVMGYAEHCNGGPNYVAFNTDVLSNLVSIEYPHTLAYDANGGSGAPSSNTVTSTSDTENMTVSSTTPTRTGYDFAGWNTDSNGTGTSYNAGSTISVGVGTTTLFAQWEPTTYGYTIRFNANGGTGSIPKTITADGTDASVVMGDIENVIPTRNGYAFRGWSASPSWNNKRISYYYIKASDGTQSSQTGSNMSYEMYCSYTGGNSSVKTLTLYALWETKSAVFYNANGGTGSMASQTYNIGSSGVNSVC